MRPLVLAALICITPAAMFAQVERPPRAFEDFRGTWVLDEALGSGRIGGLRVAKTIVIMTTPTEISLIKDGGAPEIYRVDGAETQRRDARTAAPLAQRYSFVLAAGGLALTTKMTTRDTIRDGVTARTATQTHTEIVTDLYSVSGDLLNVERQMSVLLEPPGHLVTLADPRNNRQTIVYRRAR